MFSLRDQLFGYSVERCTLDNLSSSEKYLPFLTWDGLGGNCTFVWKLPTFSEFLAELLADPSFCPAVVNCVQTRFNSPGTDGNTVFVEMVQDAIGGALEWYNYQDAMNTWLQNNPFIAASSITYDNSITTLTSNNVQDAIDEIVNTTDISLYESGTDNGIRYTKANGTIVDLKTWHTETITPTVNTAYTITHGLASTRIQVVAYDVATGEEVDVLVSNRTAATVDITSTTSDDLEIVIKK